MKYIYLIMLCLVCCCTIDDKDIKIVECDIKPIDTIINEILKANTGIDWNGDLLKILDLTDTSSTKKIK